jgi:hypothetical protein
MLQLVDLLVHALVHRLIAVPDADGHDAAEEIQGLIPVDARRIDPWPWSLLEALCSSEKRWGTGAADSPDLLSYHAHTSSASALCICHIERVEKRIATTQPRAFVNVAFRQ